MAGIWIAVTEELGGGADGSPVLGQASFELNEELTDLVTGSIYVNTKQVAEFIANELVQLLLATDSPNLNPTTAQYKVTLESFGAPTEEFWITVPSAPPNSRTVADGIAIAQAPGLVSLTAAFTDDDVGSYLFCPAFFGDVALGDAPVPITILDVIDAHTVTLSGNAFETDSGLTVVVGASVSLGLLRPT